MAMHIKKFNAQTMIVPDSDALAQATALLLVKAFSKILAKKNEVLFIPSSGRTPIKTYHLLAARYRTAIDWSRITVIQMDEYWQMDEHKKTDEYWTKLISTDIYFHSFLQKHLVTPLGIGRFISMHKPNVMARPQLFKTQLYRPAEFAEKIAALGPIDFALHGIGNNGHIGFNEPGSSANSVIRVVKLAAATQASNFPNLTDMEKPKYGMTFGLKELSNVRHTLLIAVGTQKSKAIYNLLNRNDISRTPASVLWNSPDFGIIIDRDAASLTI